jgi:hypothetical protein
LKLLLRLDHLNGRQDEDNSDETLGSPHIEAKLSKVRQRAVGKLWDRTKILVHELLFVLLGREIFSIGLKEFNQDVSDHVRIKRLDAR